LWLERSSLVGLRKNKYKFEKNQIFGPGPKGLERIQRIHGSATAIPIPHLNDMIVDPDPNVQSQKIKFFILNRFLH
jgi:hypothetical protein